MERSIFSLAPFAQQDYFEICPTLSHVSVRSFLQWSRVPRSGWASLLTYLPVHGCLHCFQSLVITKRLWTFGSKSCDGHVFSLLLGKYQDCDVGSHWSMFALLRDQQTVFPHGWIILYPFHSIGELQSAPHSCQHLVFFFNFIFE